MTGQTEPSTRSEFPAYQPRKQRRDKDSLDQLNKQGVRIFDENGREKKADTRVFKIGGTPIDRFSGAESPEFAIMRLVKKTLDYQEKKLSEATETDREIEAIEILGRAIPNYEVKALQIIKTEKCHVYKFLDKATRDPTVFERYFNAEEIEAIKESIKAKKARDERGIVVGDVLELMLLRVQLPDGQKFSLVDTVETSYKTENGETVKKQEIYGSKKTPPYRVIEQDIPGQGKMLWVEPAFPDTIKYFQCLGDYIPLVRRNKESRDLTPEEQTKMIVYAQLHQQGSEDDLNLLAVGVKLSECQQFKKGDNVYGGIVPEEEVEGSLNNHFFDRIDSNTKTPVQTEKPVDPGADTQPTPYIKRPQSTRRITKGKTSYRVGFDDQ